jgi:hypothetical protein
MTISAARDCKIWVFSCDQIVRLISTLSIVLPRRARFDLRTGFVTTPAVHRISQKPRIFADNQKWVDGPFIAILSSARQWTSEMHRDAMFAGECVNNERAAMHFHCATHLV